MRSLFFVLASVLATACVNDVSTDGGPGDAGTGADGSDGGTGMPDAMDDSPAGDAPNEGGPTNWCAVNHPTATLCDDFDLMTMPRPEWSASGSGLTVAGPPYKSSPHALHVTGMTSSYLQYSAASASSTSTLELELDLITDGTTASGNSPGVAQIKDAANHILALTFLPGTSTGRCAFAGFTGASGTNDFNLTRGPSWHPVVLKIEKVNNTYNLACTVDGADHGWTGLTAGTALGTMSFTVGFQGSTTQTMEGWFDNVALTTQ